MHLYYIKMPPNHLHSDTLPSLSSYCAAANSQLVPFGWHKFSQRYQAPESKVWRQDSAVLKAGKAAFKAKFTTAILPTQFFPGVL